MAFTLALPSLTSALRILYPMKIYEADNKKNYLPCDIMELQEVNQFEIPNSPIDSGAVVSDTLYKLPKTITCRVYVNANQYDTFNQKMEQLQFGNGFEITGVDYQVYKNLRYIDKSEPQTSDIVGAYMINITFREVIIVEGFTRGLPPKSVSNKGYAGANQKGEVATKSTPRTALKTGLNIGKRFF